MNRYDLTHRVAVVTGGASGIGLAVATLLAASGATVAIWDVADGTDAAARLNGRAFPCDIADWSSVEAARDATLAAFGKIDILVNSAGIAGANGPVETYDNAMWDNIVRINLTGTYHADKAVIPAMRANGYGRIVNIASVAGKEGNPNAAAYSASKAGVIGLTKSLGKELAGENIAVNCVTPAAARTAIFDQMTEDFIAMMLSKIPRGRFVEVDEIAHLIAWLVSEENSFTTGGVFDISGGRATY